MAERELSIFLISAAQLRELKFSEGAAARRRRDERESSFFFKAPLRGGESSIFFKASLRGAPAEREGKRAQIFSKRRTAAGTARRRELTMFLDTEMGAGGENNINKRFLFRDKV